MNSKNYVLYLFALICLINFKSVRSQDCQERQAQAEALLRNVLRIDREELRVILTEEQFDEYCKTAKEGLILFKSYGKCLSGISKQIFSIMKSTTAKALKNHCIVNPQLSREYLSCFVDQRLTINYRKCLFKFGESLNYAAEMAEDIEIFSSLCCGFNTLGTCLDEAFVNNGACSNPNLDLRAFSKNLFKGLFGSIMDSFCSSYSQEVCKNEMEKMEEYSQENKVSVPNFSVVKSLIKLAEKLSS